jgi:tRNA pseudouridine55 synthase
MVTHSLHGLLVIDKPGGMTSRAVVDGVKRWFPRGTRIGHTGTLDPLATGVLVVCIGVATRLAEYVQDMPKTYRAGLRLGARSDTDDQEGTITDMEVEHAPDEQTVLNALRTFLGESDQTPPNYSAARVSGRRAYDLARRGRAVTLEARKVAIYEIDLVRFAYPQVEIVVRCGKGTYIRSLARDLGDMLGCGALIETLRRTRVGPFKEEDAVLLDTEGADARDRLLPLSAAVAELPRIVVDQEKESDIRQGRPVTIEGMDEIPACGAVQKSAAVAVDGRLIAVGTWEAELNRFSPSKVIVDQ